MTFVDLLFRIGKMRTSGSDRCSPRHYLDNAGRTIVLHQHAESNGTLYRYGPNHRSVKSKKGHPVISSSSVPRVSRIIRATNTMESSAQPA